LEKIGVIGQCFVQIGNVGGVVAVVVNFHGLGVDVGHEGIERVRQFGESEAGGRIGGAADQRDAFPDQNGGSNSRNATT
jgi:hypothetical protein